MKSSVTETEPWSLWTVGPHYQTTVVLLSLAAPVVTNAVTLSPAHRLDPCDGS